MLVTLEINSKCYDYFIKLIECWKVECISLPLYQFLRVGNMEFLYCWVGLQCGDIDL